MGGYFLSHKVYQNLALQQDALPAAGCEKTFTDTMSEAKAARPGLASFLKYLRWSEVLFVWKLDLLSHSLKQLIEIPKALDRCGVGLGCLQEQIDTATPGGRLVFHVFGVLAEFKRDLVRERINAG